MQPPLAREESSGQRPAQAECREELGRRAGTPPVALAGAQAQDPAGPRRPWDLDVGLAWVGVGRLYAPRELHCMTHASKCMCAARRRVCQLRGSEAWFPWRPARLCLGLGRGGQPWQSPGATASPPSCISLSLSLPAPTALGGLGGCSNLGAQVDWASCCCCEVEASRQLEWVWRGFLSLGSS